MPKITKRLVDSLKPDPSGAELWVADSELKGFGIRVQPTGIMSYVLRYRTVEGRSRRLAIGRVGVGAPEEARIKARKLLAAIDSGGDPSDERKQLRAALTVAELCAAYLKDAEARGVKASTLAMDLSRIKTHVEPLIGRRAVTTITEADIEVLQIDIALGKTATEPRRDPATGRRTGKTGLTTGGPGVASRTVGMLGTVFEFARRRKLIKENPARPVRKMATGKQRRFLAMAEIAALGAAMRRAEAVENATVIAAVRFLLMTGFRRMEALGLHHGWCDLGSCFVRFPDTKSGPQLRAIGSAAARLIAAQPVRKGCPYVFPATAGDGHFVGLPKALDRLCARVSPPLADVSVHTLRHSFASVAAGLGYSELVIAGMLGHSVPSVTGRYAHLPDLALIDAADRVASAIEAALDGRAPANVVRPKTWRKRA